VEISKKCLIIAVITMGVTEITPHLMALMVLALEVMNATIVVVVATVTHILVSCISGAVVEDGAIKTYRQFERM
jgi:hypothetical protein